MTSSSGAVSGTYGTSRASPASIGRLGHEVTEQPLDVHAAEDVIQIAGIYRIPRVKTRADDVAQLADVGADWNADEMYPGHHHLTSRQVAEGEQLA